MPAKLRIGFVFLSLGLWLLFSVPLLTQQKFDPSEVTPANCGAGKLECFGLDHDSTKDQERTPEDPAVLVRHRGLPARVDLSSHLPPVGSQGRQGSCVGWSTTYYVKTMHEHQERRWRLDAGGSVNDRCNNGAARVFSPAWTYNQINNGRDKGSSISRAFQLIVASGASSCQKMPYDVNNYLRQPSSAARSDAARYRGKSYKRIPCEQREAVRAVLADGRALVGGFKVTTDLTQLPKSGVWDSFNGNVRGGHAMAVIGYDDTKRSDRGDVGAFKFVNSWGTRFGQNGFGWISYRNWLQVCKYTYVLYDDRSSGGGGDGPGPAPKPEPVKKTTSVSAPAGLSATRGLYADKIVLSWQSAEGARAYEVQRSAQGSSFGRLGFASGTTYADTRVQPNLAYRYRLVSIGESARSKAADSPIAEGYAQAAGTQKPGRLGGLVAEALSPDRGGGVEVRWNATPGASAYTVMRYDSAGKRWRTLAAKTSETQLHDSRAPANSVLHYAVRARNSAGNGPFSVAQVRVGGSSQPPAVVARLRATRGTRKGSVGVYWSRVTGATGYHVLRYDTRVRRWGAVGRTASASYIDRSPLAASGTPVYYSVVAYNASGNGQPTTPVLGYAQRGAWRGVAPSAPTDFVLASQNGAKVTFTWKAAKKADEYYIFRKAEGEKKYKFLGSAGKQLSYSDQLPKTGVVYFYQVKAKSLMGGESAAAETISAFVNPVIAVARHRALPGQGFQKLAGHWTAVHLTNSEALPLRVDLGGRQGQFTARVFVSEQDKGTAKGSYATGSESLQTADFSFELLDKDAAVITLDSRSFYPEKLRLVFARKK